MRAAFAAKTIDCVAVCRATEKEAKDYLHHYVHEKGDWEAAGNLLRIFGMQTETLDNKTTYTGYTYSMGRIIAFSSS